MDYHLLAKNLLSEAKEGVQYKRIPKVLKFFIILGFLPLILSTLMAVCSYYITLFFYKGSVSPLKFLHNIINKEGKEVHFVTQLVIYLISWPFIFFLYVIQSTMAIIFYIQWFTLMLHVYLVTLGGVKWQPFITDADYSKKATYICAPGYVAITVFTVLLVLICIFFIIGCLCFAVEITMPTTIIYLLLVLVINPMMFRKVEVTKTEYDVLKEEMSKIE